MVFTKKTETTGAAPDKPVKTEDSVLLELSMYKQYHFQGQLYILGTPYKFTRSVALSLLEERDCNRPIWKIYRALKPVNAPKNVVVDKTALTVNETAEEAPGYNPPTKNRIEVGDDTEIADILSEVNETI